MKQKLKLFIYILLIASVLKVSADEKIIKINLNTLSSIRDSSHKTDQPDNVTIPLNNLDDLIFFGNIGVGTPPQNFIVAFDATSSDLWIPDITCTANNCGKNKYSLSKSSTGEENTSIGYVQFTVGAFTDGGLGSVAGSYPKDSIQIGSSIISGQYVAAIEIITGDIYSNVIDGVLGLVARNSRFTGEPSILTVLQEQKLISRKVVSYNLNTANGNPSIVIGSSDSNSYIGELTYLDVHYDSILDVLLDAVRVPQIQLTLLPGSGDDEFRAIFDTFTPLIYIPKKYYGTINAALGIVVNDDQQINCNSVSSLNNLELDFGKFKTVLEPTDYIALSNDKQNNSVCVSTLRIDTDGLWRFGTPFLRKYFVEFDLETNRIGFKLAII